MQPPLPPKKRKRGLRTGYTTGACAAAAAKAALMALASQSKVQTVEILLPIGEKVRFAVRSSVYSRISAKCSIIKDAGDDPDVTNGAEIFAEVRLNSKKEFQILGGDGVGVVTKPGLGLKVGGPAINPVPLKMIRDAIYSVNKKVSGYTVTVSVPEGKKMARKTLNSRLGIIDGISILGTRGTVIPYSTNAYKNSVTKAISIAVASGLHTIVLTTGSRTEKAAQKIIEINEEGFIQMGDFVGHALKEAVKSGVKKIILVAMFGKMSKIASGYRHTHARVSSMDIKVPARLAREAGLPVEIVREMEEAHTARHIYEIIPQQYLGNFTGTLCGEAARQCLEMAGGRVEMECVLVDYERKEIGRYVLRSEI